MEMTTVSLTMGLGIDGGYVEWRVASGWQRPEELADDMLAMRRLTLVDRALHDDLAAGMATDQVGRARLALCEPLGPDRADAMGRQQTLDLLRTAVGRTVVHVAGGPELARLALEADAVGVIDLTTYPLIGASGVAALVPRLTFRRTGLVLHPDGRVTSTWLRDGRR